jgi:N6-adenosine-specific RNA methylase IME4
MTESVLIARDKIRRDGGTQPRAGLNDATVAEYAEAKSRGVKFPPLQTTFDGTDYWLWDGFHRDAADGLQGLIEVWCEVRAGTRRDAVLLAAGANATHGLRRTNEDKRRAVLILLDDPEWSQWSDREIARRTHVSHPLVAEMRALTGNSSSERTYETKHGSIATMDTAAIGKRAADLATARTLDPVVLYKLEGERRALKQALKREKRAANEVALGDRIAAANAALPAMVKAGKRYGFILEDSEWPWESWSEETGMDRAEENHYPTSSIEEICARPIGDLAADDCVYALWATPSRLLMATRVMEARGFTYKTSRCWRKLLPGKARGRGYWFHFTHELVLIGVKGNPPCPAMGEQWDSLFEAPRGRNSEKPDDMHRWAERFFPSVPKLECNAREARPGWDVWGAEAPEPALIGVDLAAGPDLHVEGVIGPDGAYQSVSVTEAPAAPKPKAKAKAKPARKAAAKPARKRRAA